MPILKTQPDFLSGYFGENEGLGFIWKTTGQSRNIEDRRNLRMFRLRGYLHFRDSLRVAGFLRSASDTPMHIVNALRGRGFFVSEVTTTRYGVFYPNYYNFTIILEVGKQYTPSNVKQSVSQTLAGIADRIAIQAYTDYGAPSLPIVQPMRRVVLGRPFFDKG